MLDAWQGVVPFKDYLEVPSSRREAGGIFNANKNNRDVSVPPEWSFAWHTTMRQFILEFIIMPVKSRRKKRFKFKNSFQNDQRTLISEVIICDPECSFKQ